MNLHCDDDDREVTPPVVMEALFHSCMANLGPLLVVWTLLCLVQIVVFQSDDNNNNNDDPRSSSRMVGATASSIDLESSSSGRLPPFHQPTLATRAQLLERMVIRKLILFATTTREVCCENEEPLLSIGPGFMGAHSCCSPHCRLVLLFSPPLDNSSKQQAINDDDTDDQVQKNNECEVEDTQQRLSLAEYERRGEVGLGSMSSSSSLPSRAGVDEEELELTLGLTLTLTLDHCQDNTRDMESNYITNSSEEEQFVARNHQNRCSSLDLVGQHAGELVRTLLRQPQRLLPWETKNTTTGEAAKPSCRERGYNEQQQPIMVATQRCHICFEDYTVGDMVAWSPNPACPHYYHASCMLDWLSHWQQQKQQQQNSSYTTTASTTTTTTTSSSSYTCPLCRHNYLLLPDGGTDA
jgi:hypothetical protein